MRNITWQHRVKTGIAGSFNRNKSCIRLHLKCDGTNAETRFCLSAKRTSPFTLVGTSVQSTTGRRAVQGLYCSCKPVFCSHMTLTGYPHHSLVSPSLLLPCVTVCHYISTGLYQIIDKVTILINTVLYFPSKFANWLSVLVWCGLKWPDMTRHELASLDPKATDDTRQYFPGSVVSAKVVLSATIFPSAAIIHHVLRECSPEDIAGRYWHK